MINVSETNETIFRAFGKEFDRDQAEWLVFSDKRTDIAYAQNTETLHDIIEGGWQGTKNWTDKELQEALDELDEFNIHYHGKEKEYIDMPGIEVS